MTGPFEYRGWSDVRERARARAAWAVALNSMPVGALVAELDALENGMLFDVQASGYLFAHRVRRLAAEIAEWRASMGRGQCSSPPWRRSLGEWPSFEGLPDGGMPERTLSLPERRDGHGQHDSWDDWLAREFREATADRRTRPLRLARHFGRGVAGATLRHLSSSIDRRLHVIDNTARFTE